MKTETFNETILTNERTIELSFNRSQRKEYNNLLTILHRLNISYQLTHDIENNTIQVRINCYSIIDDKEKLYISIYLHDEYTINFCSFEDSFITKSVYFHIELKEQECSWQEIK